MKGIERLEEIIVNGTKLQRSVAAYRLYWNIRDGKGASVDKRRAMKFLRFAAEYGSIDAMYQMGWHYYTGTFVGRNIVKAIDWYRKAADKGDVWAQVALGKMYLDGERGVNKDYIQAVRLFRKAVRKSDELAFYDLGLCYDLGKGVRQSDRLACKFYSYHVMIGGDSIRVVYIDNNIAYDPVIAEGILAEMARESIESVDLEAWSRIDYPIIMDGEHWQLAVLYDDGTILECRGNVDDDIPPGYETLVETLMMLARSTYRED